MVQSLKKSVLQRSSMVSRSVPERGEFCDPHLTDMRHITPLSLLRPYSGQGDLKDLMICSVSVLGSCSQAAVFIGASTGLGSVHSIGQE